MPKKSRRVASRQAAIGKERKRRKRARLQPAQRPTVAESPVELPATASTAAEPAPARQPAPRPRARSVRSVVPPHLYLTAELRKIAIIAGAMIAILIALAFVLG